MNQSDCRIAYTLYYHYIVALHLHNLCGTDDSEEAESIRDHLDILWCKLGSDDRIKMQQLSARLYIIDPIHTSRLVGWLHMFFHSLFQLHRIATIRVPLIEDEAVKHVSCMVCHDCGMMFHAYPGYLQYVAAIGGGVVPPRTLWQYLKLDQAAAWCRKTKSRIEQWKLKGEAEANGDFYFGDCLFGLSILQRSNTLRTLMMFNLIRKQNEQIMRDYYWAPRGLREIITNNGMKDVPPGEHHGT